MNKIRAIWRTFIFTIEQRTHPDMVRHPIGALAQYYHESVEASLQAMS
ncbi:MAG: hypothetical protein ACXW4O_14535 [Candidatus Binatia bacterium]